MIRNMINERLNKVTAADQAQLDVIHDRFVEGIAENSAHPLMSNHIDVMFQALKAMRKVTVKPATATTPETSSVSIPNGTYTVVLSDDESDYVTLRVERASWVKDDTKTSVSFLNGSDNESSYKGFAFVGANGINVWKNFKDNTRIVNAAKILWAIAQKEAGLADAHEKFLEFAEAYAIRSGKCARCARTLTVPASLHRGLGPECASKEGF
jgi:hypothetical protein